MAYNRTPDTVSAAYRPIKFRVIHSDNDPVRAIKVELLVNSVKELEFYVNPTIVSGNNYTFDFDVSILLQRFLGPYRDETNIGFTGFNKGGAGVSVDKKLFAKYKLRNFTVIENEDGLLTVSTTPDESNDFFVLSASPDKKLNGQLIDYAYTGTKVNPLTRGLEFTVGKNDGHMIGFLGKGITHMLVVAGNNSAIASINTDVNVQGKWWTGCGPRNLSQTGWIMTSGTFLSDFSSVDSYYVVFGIPNSSWVLGLEERTERIQFSIQERCGLRLYWLNRLGGIDQFTFTGQQITEQIAQGQVLPVAGAWGINSPRMAPDVHESVKLNATAQDEIQVRCAISDTEAAWVKDLGTAPEVYVEVDGKLTAVQISNGSFRIEQSDRYTHEVSFTVLSDSLTIQSM